MRVVPSASALSFRPMQLDDLPAVAEIERSAYPFPWTLGIFRDCLRASYGCLVAEKGGEIAGYGVLSAAAEEAHLLNVCVAPLLQKQGVGEKLVGQMLHLALWFNAKKIFLEVRPSNGHAIALYRRLGFAEIGRRAHYYPAHQGREDAIVMALDLPKKTAV